MILTTLKNHKRIEPLHPMFKQLFEFVNSTDFDSMETGRIEIDGDNLFINHAKVDGAQKETQLLEVHQTYIDVHILLHGSEIVGYKDIAEVASFTQPYNVDTDCALTQEQCENYFTLKPGDICVVFPEDAHAPAISDGPIHKLVAKIKVQ